MHIRQFRIVLVCLVICLLGSCRLIQTPTEGGSIKSASGNSDCLEDSCTVELIDHFMETYTAEPDPGYFFVGWEKYCTNNPTAPCEMNIPEIFTQITMDIELVARFQRKEIPDVTWQLDLVSRNSVTDLAGCIDSVLACLGNSTALAQCFSSEVSICSETDPVAGCCTQTCSEQISQLLDSGASEHDTLLAVLVNDGSCMPDIEAWTSQ